MTPSDLERFRKMAGLLGSEHDGERAAAALKATAWLKEHGLTWADVMVPVPVVDVLAQRRETMGGGQWASSDQIRAATRERERKAREDDRAARKAAWEQARQQPDSDGFYADLRETIRKRTGGEDGQRDPRVRKS